jgi:hypothetical protein
MNNLSVHTAVLPLVVMFVLFARSFIADAVKGAVRG